MMTKLFLTLATTFLVCSTLSAQEKSMWVGGSVGVWSSKVKGGDGTLSYKLAPQYGYRLNNSFAVGISAGFMHSENTGISKPGGMDSGGSEADGFMIAPLPVSVFLKIT